MSNSQNNSLDTEIKIINGNTIIPFGSRKKLAAALAALSVLDRLTSHHTAFRNFTEILEAAGNYRPSLEVPDKKTRGKLLQDLGRGERGLIAEVYDQAMSSLKDERRAYRYSPPKKKRTPTFQRKTIQVREG